MRRLYVPPVIAFVTLAAGAVIRGQQSTPTAPDLIIYNGKIVTVNSAFSIAQAASIRGGRFVQVGNDRDLLASAGPSTVKVDLSGRTVLPGFNDTHNHQ